MGALERYNTPLSRLYGAFFDRGVQAKIDLSTPYQWGDGLHGLKWRPPYPRHVMLVPCRRAGAFM